MRSDIDMPPFDRVAMDGFACRRADLGKPLEIIETVPAGTPPTKIIGRGQCAKIMTGASASEGADCVAMIENCTLLDDGKVICAEPYNRSNICPRGEDVQSGDVLLKKGTKIAARHIPILAAGGCAFPIVAKRPRVSLLTTGDELVTADKRPGPGQIRDSNGPQLRTQILSAGCELMVWEQVGDTVEALRNAMNTALENSDVVLLSGGVSMGEFDFVPQIIKESGFKILFEKVAIKPGKPTKFAVSDKHFCFGLPGNPVSTFVQFELLVRPFFTRLMGGDFTPYCPKLPLAKTIRRSITERMEWLPVSISADGTVHPCEHHGSGHIASLAEADGLISMNVGQAVLEEGSLVRVRPL
jgi:molybdopterin molybdotransferase